MKKLIALILALTLCLAACGGNSGSKDTPLRPETGLPAAPESNLSVVPENTPVADNAAIVSYVEENKADLLAEMEESFAGSSGMTCTSDIRVSGMGFVITLYINEMDNVDAQTKAFLQETYDSMDSYFESSLDLMQMDLPELEYFEMRVCEVDGDLLATIVADGSVKPTTNLTPSATDNSAIIQYVDANKADLLSQMEASFASSSDMTCTSDIQVAGMGFVISIYINELNYMDAETKALMQESYDLMGDYFDSLLEMIQLDLPQLEYYEIRVCEVDGDLLASVVSGNK